MAFSCFCYPPCGTPERWARRREAVIFVLDCYDGAPRELGGVSYDEWRQRHPPQPGDADVEWARALWAAGQAQSVTPERRDDA